MIRKLTAALAVLLLAAIPTLAQSPTGSWQVDAYPVDAAGHPAATTVKVPFSGVPIAPAQIPAPTASTLGGVKSSTAPANNFQTGIDTGGNPTYAQPAAGNVSGLTAGATAAAGQLPGTATNDNASAGNIGEYLTAATTDAATGAIPSSTVTITIASPAVVNWGSTPPFTFSGTGCAVVSFATTGALPTGITAGTNYYVISSSVSGNTFQIATSPDNALAGTAINTSGTQSGTHTGTAGAVQASATGVTVAALNLTAGDWDVSASGVFAPAGSTSVTVLQVGTSTVADTSQNSPGQMARLLSAAYVPGVAAFMPVGPRRFSLSGSTKIYMVVSSSFTVSTMTGGGAIRARRVR